MNTLDRRQSSFPLKIWAGCLIAIVICHNVKAQTNNYVEYRLQSGENLSYVVTRYLQNSSALPLVASLNKVTNPNIIPTGFILKIPRTLLKYELSRALVTNINCQGVTRLVGTLTQTVQLGDILTEGQVLRIPAGCQLSLTLEDESQLKLLSGALFKIATLRKNALEHAIDTRFDLLDGQVETNVPRKRGPGDASFEIYTPASMAGVRGTDFRVWANANSLDSRVEVVTGVVAARGKADTTYQNVAAGQGLAISGNGRAMQVESLLPAPTFDQGVMVEGGSTWRISFSTSPPTSHTLLRTFSDASFSVPSDEMTLGRSPATLMPKGASTIFQEWTSISETGVMGNRKNYGFCSAYKLKEEWRCNVQFDLGDLNNTKLRFERIADATSTVILDQAVKPNANSNLYLRGVPAGLYKWQIDYDLPNGITANRSGTFELIALHSE